MKPLTQNRNTFLSIYNLQTPLQWKKLNDSLKMAGRSLRCWLLSLSSHGKLFLPNRIPNLRAVAVAVKAAVTTLDVLVLSVTTNKRLYVGLVFIGVIAPLAGCSYLLFDRTVLDREWYHLNNFYLLLLLGPFITGVFICIGVYHLFPNGSKRAFLLALPMGYLMGKIIWLYQIKSNDEFYELTPVHIILVGVLISIVLLISIEWLEWRWAHRTRAFDCRLDSLDNIVNEESISDAKFRSMFRTIYNEKKNFPKEY
jgi:hypothetical protein